MKNHSFPDSVVESIEGGGGDFCDVCVLFMSTWMGMILFSHYSICSAVVRKK
jgi:hypothetical protein